MITLRRPRRPDRIATAPEGYARVHARADLVRHAALLESLPKPGEVRAITTPGRVAGTWNLDVGARDRHGLLASFTGVLAAASIDVVQAVLATWDDGAALQAFVVRGPMPDAGAVQRDFERSLCRPLTAPPIAGATVRCDETGDAYVGCEVTAPDQPGLLHAIAVAIASAGADIHAASVTTGNGVARDRFDLTGARGLEPTIAQHLCQGR